MLHKLKEFFFNRKNPTATSIGNLHPIPIALNKSAISFVLEFINHELAKEIILYLLKVQHSKTIHVQVIRGRDKDRNKVFISIVFNEQDLKQVYDIVETILKMESEIKNHGEDN